MNDGSDVKSISTRETKSSARVILVVLMVMGVTPIGMRRLCAEPISYPLVSVGDPGNGVDPGSGPANGKGRVSYEYQIGKYLVTIAQYAEFLNAVARDDLYATYNPAMATDLNVAGISRSGTSGAYVYSVLNNSGSSANRPITYVGWYDAARFANWMSNGQPTGPQGPGTTENGAYALNGATVGPGVMTNEINPNTGLAPAFRIPTEDEWHKAAFYSPSLNSGAGGYYTYSTQSFVIPGNAVGSLANQTNWRKDNRFSTTQSTTYLAGQNYLTDVGAFTNSASFYGTFDQSGSVTELVDYDRSAASRYAMKGASWANNEPANMSNWAFALGPNNADAASPYVGFRLASTVAVPEPAFAGIGAVVAALAVWRLRR